jgi:hypothetical protein
MVSRGLNTCQGVENCIGHLSIVFSLQRTVCSPTGTDPESKVGDQEIGSPGRQFPSGLQVTGEQEQNPIGDLPSIFFEQNILQLPRQRLVIIRVDSLTLWKRSNAVFVPKNSGENFSSGFLHSEFLGSGKPLCPHSIDCNFVSGSQ